jgi:hypothetical protein
LEVFEKELFPEQEIFILPYINGITKIAGELSFDAEPSSLANKSPQLEPNLALFRLSFLARLDDKTERRYQCVVTRAKEVKAKIANLMLEELSNEMARASLGYDIVLDQDWLAGFRQQCESAEPVGCVFRYFLPNEIVFRFNPLEEKARYIQKAIVGDRPPHSVISRRESVIPHPLLRKLEEKLGEKWAELFPKEPSRLGADKGTSCGEWIERTQKLPIYQRLKLRDELGNWAQLPAIIREILRSEQKASEPEFQLFSFAPRVLSLAARCLEKFLAYWVKYLGPLRDQPRALCPRVGYADPADIGIRGEITAQVLYLHLEKIIQYIPSAAFDQANFTKAPFDPSPVTGSLEAAINDWLKYLGLAQSVHAQDRGL